MSDLDPAAAKNAELPQSADGTPSAQSSAPTQSARASTAGVSLTPDSLPSKDQFEPPLQASLSMGVIGNCAFSALIDKRGRIVWCCLPRFDGDPVFNALLDPSENGSAFNIDIEDLRNRSSGTAQHCRASHEADRQARQELEITDFAPRFFSRSRFFRPLTMVRRVRPIKGAPRIRVSLDVRYDGGKTKPGITRGSNHLRYVGEAMTLRLNTDASISHILSKQPFVLFREHNFILGADETLVDGIADTARYFEQETLSYWKVWSKRLAIPLEWQDAVIRAAITLKLSLFEDTGAIVAAMTTSIPEAPGSQRNWDYRFCWLRDAFFVVRALNSLSEVGTMEDYLKWLGNVVIDAHGEHIQPLYGIGMKKSLPESMIEHMPDTAAWADSRGQSGAGAFPARCVRQHHSRRGAGISRQATAQPRRPSRIRSHGSCRRTRDSRVRHTRRGHVGAADSSARAHLVGSHELGCLRPARQDCSASGQGRPARVLSDHAKRMRDEILANRGATNDRLLQKGWRRDLDASILLMAEVGFIDPRDFRDSYRPSMRRKVSLRRPYMRRYEAP